MSKCLIVFRALWAAGLGVAAFTYWKYDPALYHWFPKCPFFALTGLKCPGCGSQRSLHALLHGDFRTAWQIHPLLVLSLPYLFAIIYLEYLGGKERFPAWRQKLMGPRAAKVALWIVLAYWLGRNM